MTNNDLTMVKELRRSLCVSLFLSFFEWYKNESESLPANVSPCDKQINFYVRIKTAANNMLTAEPDVKTMLSYKKVYIILI